MRDNVHYILNIETFPKYPFFKFSSVTELPVNCPDFSDTVTTDPDSNTHTFETPSFGPNDVTVLSSINAYFYHGTLTVSVTVPGEPDLPIGNHTITTVIADDVLQRNCSSTLTVQGNTYFRFYSVV